jgi:hypothetical protein
MCTETVTQTFTVADIGKVIDCIASDLDMNASVNETSDA